MKSQARLLALSMVVASMRGESHAEVRDRISEAQPEIARAYDQLARGCDRVGILCRLKAAPARVTGDSEGDVLRQTIVQGVELAIRQERNRSCLPCQSVERAVVSLIDSQKPSHYWLHHAGYFQTGITEELSRVVDPFDRVLALGERAIPALIEHLNNRALTRIVLMSDDAGDWPYVFRMHDVALCLIEKISRCYFDVDAENLESSKQHVARWWHETRSRVPLDRMKWQFAYTSGISLQLMFEEFRKLGQVDYLKSSLKAKWSFRPEGDVWNHQQVRDREIAADLLGYLGELVEMEGCIRSIQHGTGVPYDKTLWYIFRFGEEEHFRVVADAARRHCRENNVDAISEIYRCVTDSRREHRIVVLESLLESKDTVGEGTHPIATYKHDGVVRYCDAAMHYLREAGKVSAFELTWPTEVRDRAIREYLQESQNSHMPK